MVDTFARSMGRLPKIATFSSSSWPTRDTSLLDGSEGTFGCLQSFTDLLPKRARSCCSWSARLLVRLVGKESYSGASVEMGDVLFGVLPKGLTRHLRRYKQLAAYLPPWPGLRDGPYAFRGYQCTFGV